MKNLFIEPTQYTPWILFDPVKNKLEIKGESYSQNTAEFYAPVFAWLKEYLRQLETQSVTVNIELSYFNSSSSKILLDFFDLLDKAVEEGKNIAVNWHYEEENEDNLEYGKEFQEDVESLPFTFMKK